MKPTERLDTLLDRVEVRLLWLHGIGKSSTYKGLDATGVWVDEEEHVVGEILMAYLDGVISSILVRVQRVTGITGETPLFRDHWLHQESLHIELCYSLSSHQQQRLLW